MTMAPNISREFKVEAQLAVTKLRSCIRRRSKNGCSTVRVCTTNTHSATAAAIR